MSQHVIDTMCALSSFFPLCASFSFRPSFLFHCSLVSNRITHMNVNKDPFLGRGSIP